jgi:hypothetical protein
MRHETDIFYKKEDMFYNVLLADLFRGGSLREETVEYCRHPGHSSDRQSEKFRRPIDRYPEEHTEEECSRLRLAELLIHEQVPATTTFGSHDSLPGLLVRDAQRDQPIPPVGAPCTCSMSRERSGQLQAARDGVPGELPDREQPVTARPGPAGSEAVLP